MFFDSFSGAKHKEDPGNSDMAVVDTQADTTFLQCWDVVDVNIKLLPVKS